MKMKIILNNQWIHFNLMLNKIMEFNQLEDNLKLLKVKAYLCLIN